MVLKRISLLASLFFLLLGTNVLAQSDLADTTSKSRVVAVESTKTVEATEPSFFAFIVPGSIALIMILGFSSYWLIFRKKYLPK